MVLYPNKLPESERVCSGICTTYVISIIPIPNVLFLSGMESKIPSMKSVKSHLLFLVVPFWANNNPILK